MSIDFSWHKRAQDCIAQGALTNSKNPNSFVFGCYPTHLKRGQGCFVWDIQGRKYIDYICGLGANLTGYANTKISAAISRELNNGISLSLSSTLEVEYAEQLKQIFPFCHQFKFLKTGSEAAIAALRIARAFTGKSYVLSDGYHGWHDIFVSQTKPATGVKDDFKICKFDIEIFNDADNYNDVSAVIVEPVITDNSENRMRQLMKTREICTRENIILIFDEIITGFRYADLAVCLNHKIKPDILLLGKSIGGGLPLSAVGGRSELMNNPNYFVSSTFAGDRLSLAAAMEQLKLIRSCSVELQRDAADFKNRFNSICREKIYIDGYDTRGVFKAIDDEYKALFFQEAIKCGILFGPSWFFCTEHKDHTYAVIESCNDIIKKINRGDVRLEGKMPQSPFAQKVRDGK